MLEKNDKHRLYWLMDQYLLGKINAWSFCDEYYTLYNLSIEPQDLTDLEQYVFNELDEIVSRFTDEKEDLIKYSGVYYDEDTLKQKVFETKSKLSK